MEKLKEIIKEELSDFGGKPADNIAKNIQSRVSLYFSRKNNHTAAGSEMLPRIFYLIWH